MFCPYSFQLCWQASHSYLAIINGGGHARKEMSCCRMAEAHRSWPRLRPSALYR